MTRVAIFPAGSEIGLEIWNALRYEKNIEVIGLASIYDHSETIYKELYMVPFYNADNFITELNGVLTTKEIDYIYPAYDDVLLFLTQNQDKIMSKVITSEINTVEITRSKRKTYGYLENKDFIPQTYDFDDEDLKFPLFAKPDYGQGSKGAMIINSFEDIKKITDTEKYVLVEYLPGEEFTVDCFTNLTGNIIACNVRNRERIRCGISVRSKGLELDAELRGIAERINESFQFRGAWFFQVKIDANGKYKLLEIAPRIAGTMALTRNLGINLPLLTIYLHDGFDVGVIKNDNNIIIEKAFFNRFILDLEYSVVYIDLDDTIIVKNQVNCQVLSFLYQCKNAGKRIVLLSRHREGNVEEYLQSRCICPGLFDKICVLSEEENKSEYICEDDAIFIDDSYRERADVSRNCKVPVFGLDAIESLIDWRR